MIALMAYPVLADIRDERELDRIARRSPPLDSHNSTMLSHRRTPMCEELFYTGKFADRNPWTLSSYISYISGDTQAATGLFRIDRSRVGRRSHQASLTI